MKTGEKCLGVEVLKKINVHMLMKKENDAMVWRSRIGSKRIKLVTQVGYLGSYIKDDAGCDKEIRWKMGETK